MRGEQRRIRKALHRIEQTLRIARHFSQAKSDAGMGKVISAADFSMPTDSEVYNSESDLEGDQTSRSLLLAFVFPCASLFYPSRDVLLCERHERDMTRLPFLSLGRLKSCRISVLVISPQRTKARS